VIYDVQKETKKKKGGGDDPVYSKWTMFCVRDFPL
jgi:hypothetical protein